MKPFWRNSPLSAEEQKLLNAVFDAHNQSAFRQNPSTLAVGCVAQGSGDISKSIAAGLMALGGQHGPIIETYDILKSERPARDIVDEKLEWKTYVPGWGSSFVKHDVDPIWNDVNGLLALNHKAMWERMNDFTEALKEAGKELYPNPSAFTAATAIVVGLPRSVSPYLLIVGRISAWTEIFLNETKGR